MQQSENAVKAPSRETELATAPIGKLMAKMAVPCIAAQIINALYNIVDRIYVGRIEGVGKTALAGLGVAFPLIMVISAFAYLIGQGGAPLASIKMGAGKKEEAEKILSKCFGLMVIVSAVLMVVIYIVKTPLLVAFGASDATLPYAEEYLSIYLIGTVFVQISLGMNFFVTAQGFTSVSMKTTVIGAVINIILDPVFIFGFHMGVAGAAIATVIAQAASAVWVLFFLFGKKTTLRLRFADMRPQWKVLGPVLGLGLSPFIMNVTESAIQVVFTAGMQQYGGDDYVSVVSVLVTCITVIMMPMTGMCQGAQPITSYNYGAGNTDRVRATFRRLITCNGIYCLAVWGLIQLFPTVVIRLFSDDMSLMDIGAHGARIFLFGVITMFGQNACQQTFMALGQAKVSMFCALLRKVILLIPLALLLPVLFQNTGILPATDGIFLAEPIADILASVTTTTIFFFRFRKLLGEIDSRKQAGQA